MKPFLYGLAACFVTFSCMHMIFGKTENAIWLCVMASFWLALSKES